MTRIKRNIFWVVIGLVGVIAVTIFISMYVVKKDTTLFTVNGMTVTQEEMDLYAERNRANVIATYSTEIREHTDGFWNTASADGTLLLDILKRKCVEELIEVKVIHQLAKEYGIDYIDNYEVFQKRLNEENERRRKAIESGEILYGPDIYDSWDYYNYLNDQTRIALENYLKNEWPESADAYQKYYEEHKENYTKALGVELQIYKWTYENEAEKVGAVKSAEQYITRVEGGELFEKLDDSMLVKTLGSEATQRSDSLQFPMLLGAAKEAHAGDIIGPIVEMDAVYVACCLKEYSVKNLPYEEVEPLVKIVVWNEYFQSFLENEVSQAVVKYADAYDQWTITE